MKFEIEDGIFEKFSGLNIGLVVCKGIVSYTVLDRDKSILDL